MKDIATLLKEYWEGTLSPAEQQIMQDWANASEDHQHFFREMTDPEKVMTDLRQMETFDEAGIWQKIREKREQAMAPVRRLPRFFRYGWAAAAVTLIGVGTWWFAQNRLHSPTPANSTAIVQDIPAPSANRATITLAGGQRIYLDSAANGALAYQGNARVVKLADGQVTYKIENLTHGEMLYNNLTNPRGSQVVRLTLADGSRVWLNAGSTITYPVAFIGKERAVSIDGEAYFEITPDAAMPFRVRKGKTEVTVLGTNFNVNAYDDETSIRVTLLQGSVKVSNGGTGRLLKPGRQAVVTGVISLPDEVDLEEVMAWKNGEFQFGDKSDIGAVMRQIARWYNVEIEYQGNRPILIGGSISRDVNISRVLEMLQKTGAVRFRVEGNKITVLS